MILTPLEARILYQIAGLKDLRNRYRIGNTDVYRVLTDISVCAFSAVADPGNEPRREPASEEREMWTVQRIARAAGLSTRTVRLDAQHNRITGTKVCGTWTFAPDAALTYISTRRRTS